MKRSHSEVSSSRPATEETLLACWESVRGPASRDLDDCPDGSLWGVRMSEDGKSPLGVYWSGEKLRGRIPPLIADLTTLRHLELHFNPEMAGRIPSELGRLTNLTTLHLPEQLVTRVPDELGSLVSLESLYLPPCGRLPASLSALTRLRHLVVGGDPPPRAHRAGRRSSAPCEPQGSADGRAGHRRLLLRPRIRRRARHLRRL
mmetsp:Transcript_31068/g.61582  ORF Transcript_31068/g.61582 Transcript_31068/m.61582 type:complete len:203 (+) Transcript_31068:184-792(+)